MFRGDHLANLALSNCLPKVLHRTSRMMLFPTANVIYILKYRKKYYMEILSWFTVSKSPALPEVLVSCPINNYN